MLHGSNQTVFAENQLSEAASPAGRLMVMEASPPPSLPAPTA